MRRGVIIAGIGVISFFGALALLRRNEPVTAAVPQLAPHEVPVIRRESLPPDVRFEDIKVSDFPPVQNVGDAFNNANVITGRFFSDRFEDAKKFFVGEPAAPKFLPKPPPVRIDDGLRATPPPSVLARRAPPQIIINTGRSENNPSEYDELIYAAARKAGIAPAILKEQLIQESNLNPDATGPELSRGRQAKGIAQFLDTTWAEWGPPGTTPYNAPAAIDAAARYMRMLIEYFDGDIAKALQGYNFGMGNVKRGKPLPRETRNYYQTILRESGAGDFLDDPDPATP